MDRRTGRRTDTLTECKTYSLPCLRPGAGQPRKLAGSENAISYGPMVWSVNGRLKERKGKSYWGKGTFLKRRDAKEEKSILFKTDKMSGKTRRDLVDDCTREVPERGGKDKDGIR